MGSEFRFKGLELRVLGPRSWVQGFKREKKGEQFRVLHCVNGDLSFRVSVLLQILKFRFL